MQMNKLPSTKSQKMSSLDCSEVYLRLENESEDQKRDEVISDLFKNLEKPVDLDAIENEVRQMLNGHESSHSHKKKHSSSSKQVKG